MIVFNGHTFQARAHRLQEMSFTQTPVPITSLTTTFNLRSTIAFLVFMLEIAFLAKALRIHGIERRCLNF